jgi:predicted amidohydrolase
VSSLKLHLACAQIAPTRMKPDKNMEKIEAFITRIMKEKPDTNLIVFPELATSGCEGTKSEFDRVAQHYATGESFQRIGELARFFDVHIVYGYPQRDDFIEDVLYNAVAMIDNRGKAIGNYQKVHPFGNEVLWMRPGHEFPIIETELGKIGMMNCWDTAFPEVARIYALKGADLLTSSANWESPYFADWDLCTKARCLDNILPMAACNRVGKDLELSFFGHSCIIDGTANVIAKLNEPIEDYIYGIIDTNESKEKRVTYYTYFTDRKPQLYDEITKVY